MLIRINKDKCIGAGNCVMVAPTVFTQDEDDGRVILLDPNPSEDLAAEVAEAIEICPAKVISRE